MDDINCSYISGRFISGLLSYLPTLKRARLKIKTYLKYLRNLLQNLLNAVPVQVSELIVNRDCNFSRYGNHCGYNCSAC